MNVFTEISNNIPRNCIATVGFFDGVHLGHKFIIDNIRQIAEDCNVSNLVITMDPHPATFFGRNITLLSPLSEKLQLFEKRGVSNVLILPFNENIAKLSGTEFIQEILHDKLSVSQLVLGYNNSIGRKVNGVAEIPEDIIPIVRLEKFMLGEDDDISSSSIRNAMASGNIELSNKYLGYQYSISGKVVNGCHVGRTMNFPTANIVVNATDKCLPVNGVYIVEGLVNDTWMPAMLNIGTRPTFGENATTIELHILNYSGDLYGKDISVRFLKKIRDEKKYQSLEALASQLQKDKQTTENYFLNRLR